MGLEGVDGFLWVFWFLFLYEKEWGGEDYFQGWNGIAVIILATVVVVAVPLFVLYIVYIRYDIPPRMFMIPFLPPPAVRPDALS